MKKGHAITAALVALVLLAAACGGNGDGTNGGTTTPPAATDGTDTPTPDATETSGETRIAMEDFRFEPSTFSVSTSTTLELDNEGETPHTFTIQDQGIDVQVNAGENGTVTIDLPAGDYDFVCTIHVAQGMVGTMTVTG